LTQTPLNREQREENEMTGNPARERWTVGDYTITSIVEEQSERVPVEFVYRDKRRADLARHSWLVPDFADETGRLRMRVQAFAIQGRGRTLLVDPCVGNQKRRQNPYWNMREWPFLERMAAAGFTCEAIDTVVHTHLHEDHLGWDTQSVDGALRPTFSRARHLYTARELEKIKAEASPEQDTYGDSIAPIFAAGLADVIDDNAELAAGIRLESTPGHGPGHVCVWIESGGEVALITGDIVHNPVQCAEPEWAAMFDADPEGARVSRLRMLEAACKRGALVLGTHFPNKPAGKLIADGAAYRFVPV
jgi:glyoxylase-like metal-dependent hydrolase (beta-lactamase superfamily II)